MIELVSEHAGLAATATVMVFACLMGGNLGSFLNVVMHRVPRGESVAGGGSRCPACGSGVRWHDNVPVLGWLWLGGRCRDCRSPIATRYPLVEAAGAAIGGVVGVSLLGGGRLLPGDRFAAVSGGGDALLLDTDWAFVLVCLAHATLLFLLLAWAICELDRLRVSPTWLAAAVVILAGLAVIAGGPTTPPGRPAAAAAALGGGLGGIFASAMPGRWLRQALILAGVSLGWQALATTVAIMPLTAAVRVALGHACGSRPAGNPSCGDLLGAACVQVLAWRWLAVVWTAA